MTKFKIEKNIPKRGREKRNSQLSEDIVETMKKLNIGDSFLIPCIVPKIRALRARVQWLRRTTKGLGNIWVSTDIEIEKGKQIGIRVWRDK